MKDSKFVKILEDMICMANWERGDLSDSSTVGDLLDELEIEGPERNRFIKLVFEREYPN